MTAGAGLETSGEHGTVATGSVLAAAALGAALTPLNSTMVAVALPALGSEFSAPASTITLLVVTGYLVATLVAQMPAGSVADRLGHVRALALGRWVFGAGALLGFIAPTLLVLVAGRLLMAIGGALVIPTAMALVRVAVPPDRRTRAFGTLGAVMGGAAAIGPALGTWLVAQFGWRVLFAVNLPLIVGSWLLQPRLGVETPRRQSSAPFDWPGSVLIGAALVLVTFATRTAAPRSYGLAAAGIAAFIALVYHERRVPAPVLNVRLFTRLGFVAGAGVIATQNLAMYSLLIQVPFLFGDGTGANTRLGLAIVAMTATMALSSPVSGRLAEQWGARLVVAAGGLLATAGVVALMRLPSTASAVAVGLCLLPVGLGLGLSTGPANAGALSAVAAHEAGMAAATVSMLRYVGSIGGTVILSFAFASGAGAGARHRLALWIYVAALLISATLGGLLPPTPPASPALGPRPR